jgi:hypothetical protein
VVQSALPDWRMITIGFVAGVLVTTLVGLQLREWRRRAAQPAQPPAPAEEAAPTEGADAEPAPAEEAPTGLRAPE